eukprot:CAMPEP_0203760340 /NCGR_PEP_ID=MMETSP0098-20131031/13656_1 /ASSEMBLY_ACC=CAM_ASM_000208 /TAXON_ID=96639 /ORGANISM=" , Strain NY0313808BC1" /LENGTH=311 /DNA_ID=CAMNT_0050653859 /DNA_START=445 /DNA_END=1380 /DNA_ORIENTATION=+
MTSEKAGESFYSDEHVRRLEAQGFSSVEIKVEREYTDFQGNVHHRDYLAWFERGREHVIFINKLTELYEEFGQSFVVTASEQVFHSAAKYGDIIEVRTIPLLDGLYRIGFDQSIWRSNTNELLVSGFVEMVVVNSEFKPVQLPPLFKNTLSLFEKFKKNCSYIQPKRLPKIPLRKTKGGERSPVASFEMVYHQAGSDFTGVTFHPNYYCWFARARVDFFGLDFLKTLEHTHGILPTTQSAKLKYKNSTRPYEKLLIETFRCPEQSTQYVLALDQVLYRDPGKVECVIASFEVAFTCIKTGALVPVPKDISM